MVTEPVLNTMMAEYLARGLARALRVPEARVRVFHRRDVRSRQPDIRVVDIFGVTIVVQGKIENIDRAVVDCKDAIDNDLADLCFAVSYPRQLAALEDITEVRSVLEGTKLEIAIVKPPQQLTLEGWPQNAVRSLGALTPLELLELLQGESIYDEIVGVESAESIAQQVSQALDVLAQLPAPTIRSIHSRVSEILGVTLQRRTGEDEQPDE